MEAKNKISHWIKSVLLSDSCACFWGFFPISEEVQWSSAYGHLCPAEMLMLVRDVQSCSSHHVAGDGTCDLREQPGLPRFSHLLDTEPPAPSPDPGCGEPSVLGSACGTVPQCPTARQGSAGTTKLFRSQYPSFSQSNCILWWENPSHIVWGCLLQPTCAVCFAAWEGMLSLTSVSTECLLYFFLCILHTECFQAAWSDAAD